MNDPRDAALATPPGVTAVQSNSQFDPSALADYLRRYVAEFDGPLQVSQFAGGQSNPTFHIVAGANAYVMRKRPSGELLPSAHAIDREYRVIGAMQRAGLPVPVLRGYCEDTTVIGQAFYVMDFIPGRVFHDRRLPGCEPAERGAIYAAMNDTLARLHQVDIHAAGLDDFGRPDGYIARQVARWSRQYAAMQLDPCPDMDRLMAWLTDHAPQDGRRAVVHGDYRLGNLMLHPAEPRVAAVLDWELATLGDPLADLAYNVMCYYLPPEINGGLLGTDYLALGIPSLERYVADYERRTETQARAALPFYVVFSMFRSAAIHAGIYRRALDGNSVDPDALRIGAVYRDIARHATAIASAL